MYQRFLNHIQLHFSFLKKKKLIVAISGGLDSVVLTTLLHRLHFDIVLAHCNFKLRHTESEQDESFVKKIARELSVEIYTQNFATKSYAEIHKCSIQVAARTLRYQWFSTLIATAKGDYILTAHHADDTLETFLINLSRGTGLKGLSGIPEHTNYIVRPLLPFSRDTILNYARKNKLIWREDSSNTDHKYLRNTIRHKVVPQLKKIHPVFLQNFQKTLDHLSESEQVLSQHIAECKTSLFEKKNENYIIAIKALEEYTPQKTYLYEFFKEFGFTKWQAIARLLHAPSGKQLFSSTHRLLKDRDHLYITVIKHNPGSVKTIIDKHTLSIEDPITMTISQTPKIEETADHILYVDKEKLKFPLTVRKWKEGDYFYPFGMHGKKKISKFFKDEKYSLIDKENQWLLCDKHAILWIIGKRSDNRYRIRDTTKFILKIMIEQ